MTNHSSSHDATIHSINTNSVPSSLLADNTSTSKPPQSQSAAPIAPSSIIGPARYDSDSSIGIITDDDDDEEEEDNNNFLYDSYANLLQHGSNSQFDDKSGMSSSSMMESWITVDSNVIPTAAATVDDDCFADNVIHDDNTDGEKANIGTLNGEEAAVVSNNISLCKADKVVMSGYIPPPTSNVGEEEEKAISIRPSSTLYLPNLPMDTLHRLAVYLTAKELCRLSMTTKRMGGRCEEVWRRVRMHCGRCLGEVLLAWTTGEHADARELASLYLQNGVPIYPAPNGHAHATICWRMGLERKAKVGHDDADGEEDAAGAGAGNTTDNANQNADMESSFDPFYTSHYGHDNESEAYHDIFESYHPTRRLPYTYVEEKAVYWKTQKGIPLDNVTEASGIAAPSLRPSSARGRTRRSTLDAVPPGAAAAIRHALRNQDTESSAFRPLRRSSFSSSSSTGYTTTSGIPAPTPVKSIQKEHPKLTLRIHRHLADQHLFNVPSIRDEVNTNYIVSKMNLNADFFHPHIENSLRSSPSSVGAATATNKSIFGSVDVDETTRDGLQEETWETLDGRLPWNSNQDDVDWDLAGDLGLIHPFRSLFGRKENEPYNSPASDVSLQIYSVSSPNVPEEEEEKRDELMKFRVRMAAHQRKLESCVLSVQEFNDALLDWWDEVLPISAGVHFFNRQSPVPRMSHLHSFLTKPCPKAFGVVQCEIERVKVSSKKKLFPTYEYRLFIRDVKNDHPNNLPCLPPRKDSVLLVAKNKLRMRDAKSNTSAANESKKGVTNYYMCMPQQRDVDSHYRSANKSHKVLPESKSGIDAAPSDVNPIVGRVQGNFIGTEFQVFSPATSNGSVVKSSSSSSEDDNTRPSFAEAGRRRVSIDTPGTRGTNSLSRLARRASLTITRRPSISAFRRQSMDHPGSDDEQKKTKAYRRLSFTKSNRTKRSAIANSQHKYYNGVPVEDEEEIGAVTYTANLLGNRPRVMDVCIPKLNDDGRPTHVWKRTSDHDAEDGESGANNNNNNNNNSRMLSQFKAMQAAREQAEANDIGVGTDEGTRGNNSIDDNGLMVLQNRPPWWNVEIGAFVLNFGGRVSVASVKNFQLCERTDHDHIMLQFGRISGRHSFTMDFQYPLTPMQAFAIAISSLQSKLSLG